MTPRGEIIAVAGRGAWMGNRGRLHEGRGARDIVRNYRGKAWITCVLEFRGHRAAQWEPNHYTPLFFLDEAVALAAGHRPCAECRRGDYRAYQQAWAQSRGGAAPSARDMDAQLHRERIGGAGWRSDFGALPDGVFVDMPDGPAVIVGDHLAVWNVADNAYRLKLPRPATGSAAVLTPPSTVAVLRAGYPAQIDAVAH